MKKNRGFTLIELIAVIIILAAIALVIFPILLNTIKNSEGQIDDATKKLVVNAARLYVDNNLNDYSKSDQVYCISFDDLMNSQFLEKDMIDAADFDYSNKLVKLVINEGYNFEIVDSDKCVMPGES